MHCHDRQTSITFFLKMLHYIHRYLFWFICVTSYLILLRSRTLLEQHDGNYKDCHSYICNRLLMVSSNFFLMRHILLAFLFLVVFNNVISSLKSSSDSRCSWYYLCILFSPAFRKVTSQSFQNTHVPPFIMPICLNHIKQHSIRSILQIFSLALN